MLLKGFQRAGGKELALYLLHNPENEIAELHSLRNFAATGLVGALMEIEAAAKATRCPKPLFSMSFNPPVGASVSVEAFEKAFEKVERKLGLETHPRAVVFHEKEGDGGYRRHAHVVYGRIYDDNGKLRAIDLKLFKYRLQELSREIYHELGIEAPGGYRDKAERSPLNYTHDVWMQAKRIRDDPRDLRKIISDALLASGNRAAFERALAPHALYLARGNRRPYVIVHGPSCEILTLSRYSGFKPKQIAERIGPADDLQPVEMVQEEIRSRNPEAVKRRLDEAGARHAERMKAHGARLKATLVRHRQERAILFARQHEQWKAGERSRAERLRGKGITGLWDRVTGRGKIAAANAAERAEQKALHLGQKQGLIDRQVEERQALTHEAGALRAREKTERRQLRAEIATLLAPPAPERLRDAFDRAAQQEGGRENPDPGAAAPQMGDPGYAEWREAQREITRDRRSRGENGRDRGREPD